MSIVNSPPGKGYTLLIRWGSNLKSFALLVIRVGFGFMLYQTGLGKLQNVDRAAANFQSWGVPFPHLSVYVASSTELVGGVLLILGLATRLISIPLIFNFCVAYLTASRDEVKGLVSDPSHFYSHFSDVANDAAFPFLAVSLLLLAVGPGRVSVDALLKRILVGKNAPP
jgi:putative oxidoreductase